MNGPNKQQPDGYNCAICHQELRELRGCQFDSALASSEHVPRSPVPGPVGKGRVAHTVHRGPNPSPLQSGSVRAGLSVAKAGPSDADWCAVCKSFSVQRLNYTYILEAVGWRQTLLLGACLLQTLGGFTPCGAGLGTDLGIAGRALA